MPVLALVPDRADEVLCQNSWKLSSDCFVHEEQLRFMLSANSVVKVSDQVQTLSVGCHFLLFLYLYVFVTAFPLTVGNINLQWSTGYTSYSVHTKFASSPPHSSFVSIVSSGFNTPTLLVHAGLFACFRNPTNST